VTTTRHDGRGWWVLRTRAGTIPEALLEGSIEREDGAGAGAPDRGGAEALADLRGGTRMDGAARRCIASLERGEDPPPARLAVSETVDGTFLRLDVLWDPDVAGAFDALPGAVGPGHSLPIDPWIVEALDAFLALHDVAIDGSATETLAELRAEHDEALSEIRASRATTAEPIAETAAVLGGELAPFQWAGVRYVLRAPARLPGRRAGPGQDGRGAGALEADDAFPPSSSAPASLKLNWERETAKWLPHRSVAVIQGRMPVPPTAEITILNYEVVAAHRETLGRLRPRALVVDESHLCKNPQAKRTQACGAWPRPSCPTACAWP
jgi:hypothetical protein